MPWKFFTSDGIEKTVSVNSPVGLIMSYGGLSAPSGWLLCQGQEVALATYSDLGNALGTQYGPTTNGSGSAGSSHFRLPNLCGRVAVGTYAGYGDRTDTNGPLTGTGQITGSSFMNSATIGAWSGQEAVLLTSGQSATPGHSHPASAGSHNHNTGITNHQHTRDYGIVSYNNNTQYAILDINNAFTYGTTSSGISASVVATTSGITVNNVAAADATNEHNNMMPYVSVNFIIKT